MGVALLDLSQDLPQSLRFEKSVSECCDWLSGQEAASLSRAWLLRCSALSYDDVLRRYQRFPAALRRKTGGCVELTQCACSHLRVNFHDST